MRFHTIAPIVILAGLVAVAGARQGDAPKQDVKRLQGTWKLISLRILGKEIDDKRDLEAIYSFKGDKYCTSRKDEPEESQTYRLDPTQNPKHIDIEGLMGTVKGIYKFEGDTLTICLPNPFVSNERPTKFGSGLKDKSAIMVFKRSKS